jgi:hypothetical protein
MESALTAALLYVPNMGPTHSLVPDRILYTYAILIA